MADVWSPPGTAARMCALPGAVFTKVPRPDFVNGRMMRLPSSALQDMPCPSFCGSATIPAIGTHFPTRRSTSSDIINGGGRCGLAVELSQSIL